ncbi:MAG: hypothetical protein ACREVE_17190 [Gammaproteobacteria bacterium]
MKLASKLTATVLALNLATAQADEQFSTLEGIQAQAMSSEEMDAVQGKNFDFFTGADAMMTANGAFDQAMADMLANAMAGLQGPNVAGLNAAYDYFYGGLDAMAAANMAFDAAHANDPAIIANLWLQEAQALRAQGYTGPIASPPTFDQLYPNQDYFNWLFSQYIRQ